MALVIEWKIQKSKKINYKKESNMLKDVKRKLVLLYTITTGCILTIVIFGASYFFLEQANMRYKEEFQDLLYNIGGVIQNSNRISQLYLSELELKNQAIIYVEDNGKPLSFQGSWNPITKRSKLVKMLKEKAAQDQIKVEDILISVDEVQSEVYHIVGEEKEEYLGTVFITTKGEKHRNIVLLQYLDKKKQERMQQRIFLLVLDLVGVLALFFVSQWMVSKTLKPIEKNRKKQIEFIRAASHELRSPLAVIRANITAIKAEPEKHNYFLKGIDQECIWMSRLVDDMLLLASIDGKNWSIQQEKFEIETLLIEVYDKFFAYCKENHIDLQLHIPEEILPKVIGDKERMQQILTILLDNALQYAYAGQYEELQKNTMSIKPFILELSAYKHKNNIKIEVKDYGVGIEKEKQKDIFERFYRVDTARKEKQHFGLGLSIAKELAVLQQSDLYMKETEGGGCTFVVSIPIFLEE